jgi:hypothetical protein
MLATISEKKGSSSSIKVFRDWIVGIFWAIKLVNLSRYYRAEMGIWFIFLYGREIFYNFVDNFIAEKAGV